MPNNRHLINDTIIVRPTRLLERGFLPGLRGTLVVNEGWKAVVTEGGAFKEILEPGQYPLSRFSLILDVKSTEVDVRLQSMTVSTVREFTISQPLPVQINLDLSIEYRVVDARRVVLEIATPITSLYDRVIQAVRSAISFATIDEIRTQGEGLARTTLQHLQAMQLSQVLGIEVLKVHVTSIKAGDTAGDVLATQQMREMTQLRDWQIQSMIAQNSRITVEWLAMYRPDLYAQIVAGNQALLKELIDKGLLDPAGFLTQRTGTATPDISSFLTGLGAGVTGINLLQPPGLGQGGTSAPSGGTGGATQPTAPEQLPRVNSDDIHARMREEANFLKKLPGAQVQMRLGMDDHGIVDGTYEVQVEVPRTSGGRLTLYFLCSAGYPASPPASVEVDVDEQSTPFESSAVRRWNRQYLVEIVQEARQIFG